jgi:hypothetical protein
MIKRGERSRTKAYHARQSSAKFSSSLRETPRGVTDLFRDVGGGAGPTFLRPLGLTEGEVGGITPGFIAGLPGGEIVTAPGGRS